MATMIKELLEGVFTWAYPDVLNLFLLKNFMDFL